MNGVISLRVVLSAAEAKRDEFICVVALSSEIKRREKKNNIHEAAHCRMRHAPARERYSPASADDPDITEARALVETSGVDSLCRGTTLEAAR